MSKIRKKNQPSAYKDSVYPTLPSILMFISVFFVVFVLASSSVSANITKQWTVLKGGVPSLLTAEETDDMALYQILFFSAEEQNQVSLKISFEPGPQDNIYQKIILEKTNMNDDLLSAGSIKLKIKNDWIEKNVENGSSIKIADESGRVISGNQVIFSRKGDVYSYYASSVPLKTFYIATTPKKTSAESGQSATASDVTSGSNASNETGSSEKTNTQSQAQQTETCIDSIRNQNEADIDCGGVCRRCPDEKSCSVNDDCQSQFCNQMVCKTPSCSDAVLNQQESDVDCGGNCNACDISKVCRSNDDCKSRFCTEGICSAASHLAFANDETKLKSAPWYSSLAQSILSFKFDLSVESKKRIANIAIGILGLAALMAIIIFAVRRKGSGKNDPSVQDLIKLYEEIKRI